MATFPRGRTWLLVALAAAHAPALEARGGGKSAAAKLPAGCERLCDGRDAALSLDGKRLAFVRWTTEGSEVDYHGDPIPRPRLFVRDLAAKKDARVGSLEAVPVGWTQAGGVCLSTGIVVDAKTGKQVPGTARLPEKVGAMALAWSRDGTLLAFVPDWRGTPLPTPGVPQVLSLVRAEGGLSELGFGNLIYDAQPAWLAFSPDGSRLAYHAGFLGDGSLPFRRVAVVAVERGTQEFVSDMALNNRVPGMHDERRPMRAMPGSLGPSMGAAVWDAAGKQFVYVHGTGDGNADLHLCDAEGKQKSRLTKDGATKWGPALDPAGRRAAFLVAKVVEWPHGLEGRALRILDLVTQEAADFGLPGAAGMPGNAAWTPDGSKVVYEIHGGDAEGVYAQAVPPVKPAPEGAAPASVEVGADEEILRALAAGTPQRVRWACEEARKEWRESLLAPFRAALAKAVPLADTRAADDLLRLLGDVRARAALPEVRLALKAKDPGVVRSAVHTLFAWKEGDALPDLDLLRTKHTDAEVRVHAAGVMLALGDARGWPQVEQGAKDKEPDVRSAVCRRLAHVRDARSVVLLLALVSDDGFLYTTHGGDQVVGDQAVEALVRLTGRFFRRDLAAWKAWWKDEAKESLPESPDVASALSDFDGWMNEREEEHQRKMRERLGPLKPR